MIIYTLTKSSLKGGAANSMSFKNPQSIYINISLSTRWSEEEAAEALEWCNSAAVGQSFYGRGFTIDCEQL